MIGRSVLVSADEDLTAARNCTGQFSISSPGEKCQRKNGIVKILSFTFWQALCNAIHLRLGFRSVCFLACCSRRELLKEFS